MDKRKDNGISLVLNKGVQYKNEENFVKNLAADSGISPLNIESHSNTERETEVDIVKKEAELYNSVYKEISEIVGLDATLKIYLRFKGQQISFPVRLYNPNMIQQKVVKEFDGTNIHELAKKYDYSEKTIRRMIRDSVEDNGEDKLEDEE